MFKLSRSLPIMGWRERILLPEFHIKPIIAKVDTGAKTCSLHAEDIKVLRSAKKKIVKFTIYPYRKHRDKAKRVSAELISYRWIKDTGGNKTFRPVVRTKVQLGSYEWDIDITLVDRNSMRHRFLLARDAVKGRFVIDVAHSFLLSKSKKVTSK